jgi:hypothetical protein
MLAVRWGSGLKPSLNTIAYSAIILLTSDPHEFLIANKPAIIARARAKVPLRAAPARPKRSLRAVSLGRAAELFRPFERRSHDRSGLVLGLSISRKSVEAEGGALDRSDRLGFSWPHEIQ